VPDYDDLSTIVGQMKRAAIDCWMADQDFFPVWGNEGTYAKWHFAPYQYFRPEADGSGGGDGVGYNVSCAGDFDAIRSAIDGVVDKWFGLPDGSACAQPSAAARTAASVLGSDGAGASVQNGGAISTSNSTINTVVLGNMEGAFRRPFLGKYYTAFSAVQSGLAQAAVILQANYAAEGAMWNAVKADVAQLCTDATNAWKAQAESASAANGQFQLSVATAVAGAVASVVTAPTGLGVAVAGLSATAVGLNTALSAVNASVAVSGDSYSSILDSLIESLDKLNATIRTQESELTSALDEATSQMTADAAGYNLDRVALGDYPLGDGSMRMDSTDAGIVSDNMRIVHDELIEASSALGTGPTSAPTPRHAGIGMSSTGTHSAASRLHVLASEYLQATRDEYGRGHGLFDATVADFFGSDAAARRTVQQLLADEALTGQGA
jgi:hypothetical protein